MNLLCPSLYLDDSDLLYPERQTEEESVVHNSFRNFVDKTLSGCNNNSLKKFSLNYEDDDVQRMSLTTRWISKAMEKGVSDLDLRIYMPLMYEPPRLLPNTVFINNTLVKLTLGTELCLGMAPLEYVGLPLLKSLFLHTVWFSDDAICDVMFDGCPELEELYIHHIYIEDRDREFNIPPAPHYLGHNNIKKLTVATIMIWGSEHEPCLKIMNSISNVQILYLSSSTVEVIYECLDLDEIPLFKNLATLHFEGNKEEYWKLLCNVIEKSPKLETLVLKGLCGVSDCGVKIDGGNVVKVVEIQGKISFFTDNV
ncbi:unnamed protein product [Arabidopsis arenosa]|uniref:F-box/LRR-repeat protein 15/At3g58940/PEG3-like LRR domain-containing protein n=1 Tax=Arabidopsis arenosa TaxID=38785 RepID=A0A8S2B0I5_ARAAE|nr:unnamed protein product [Arabidopsis arenosa]